MKGYYGIGIVTRATELLDALAADLAAAQERAETAEARIRELALLFNVPDGGRYLNDWKTRATQPESEDA